MNTCTTALYEVIRVLQAPPAYRILRYPRRIEYLDRTLFKSGHSESTENDTDQNPKSSFQTRIRNG